MAVTVTMEFTDAQWVLINDNYPKYADEMESSQKL